MICPEMTRKNTSSKQTKHKLKETGRNYSNRQVLINVSATYNCIVLESTTKITNQTPLRNL